MAEDVSSRRLSLFRQFPALRIIETAGIALSPASVLIATLASLLLSLSGAVIHRELTHGDETPSTDVISKPWSFRIEGIPLVGSAANEALLRPWISVAQPVAGFFNPSVGRNSRWSAAFQFVLGIALWSLAGSILCRRSAMLFVRNDESTVRQAVDYCVHRWLATVSAPLIPLISTLLLGLVLAAIGLLGRLPGLGFLLVWIAIPLVTVMGFAMSVLIFATALGWPLMVAAVSTDDCDGFGALSRAYTGLTGRPWHGLCYLLMATVVGIVLMFGVSQIGLLTIGCTMGGVSLGMGEESAEKTLHGPLVWIVHEVIRGVGISFFWSASVVISLLLRQEVDGVPLDRIADDDDVRPIRDPLPVVGIPATDATTGESRI